MPSLFTLLTLPLVIPSILAGVIVQRADLESRTGRFIVRTKPTNGEASIASVANTVDPESITNHYNNVFSGFAGTFSESELESLRNDPNVESIIEDVTFSINSIVTQTDAPWGLERISHIPTIVQHSDPLTYNYTRDDSEGAGVDVYVVDTGINVNHVQFQGRAKLGWAGSGLGDGSDDQGHGTHVAGTIGSLQFGVAKKTALIAVKVLSSTGEGSGSDLVSGLDWVAGEARTSGKPSVVNLSLGFSGVFTPADDAVKRLVEAGVHVVVAAGNDNVLTTGSPAHVPEVITVGAVDINDEKADFSNFGPVIDINAPGVDILSTSFSSNTGIVSMSGTSMACPHVAGLVAYFIGLHGNMSPAAMSDFIKEKSIKGALKNLVGETPNNLAYNGVSSTLTRRHQVMRKDVRSGASWARRDRFAKRQAA